ncbi:unnamed protein product [Symbiodinium natans]|uniref:Amine oxidase domain-containing protein n=1 Tax=Symbiodinium natans TaxID=878477 RepID=A0A812V2H0_9DINO|nr:unnamed protein product [Symbiodinium natans]
MGGIVRMLAEGLDIQQDVWVPPSNGLQCSRTDGSWGITVPGERGRDVKWFDAAIIAHNGKCAERLTSSTPAQEVHALLRTNFACSLPRHPRPGSGRFTLNQIYSLLFEVPSGLMPSHFEAAFVEDEPILRWLSSNTAKLRQGGSGEVWTALSSAPFGKQHKAPQEFLEGTPKEAEVVDLMLGAVERAVGLANGSLRENVRATKLQLWGAALPITRWASRDEVDFAWSASHRIGIAGDWLSAVPSRASTIEAAWLSGVHIADHIATSSGEDAGLQLGQDGGVFVPVDADFGTAAGEAVWVTEPSEEPKGTFKGKGRSGKGWKGKGGRGRGRPAAQAS